MICCALHNCGFRCPLVSLYFLVGCYLLMFFSFVLCFLDTYYRSTRFMNEPPFSRPTKRLGRLFDLFFLFFFIFLHLPSCSLRERRGKRRLAGAYALGLVKRWWCQKDFEDLRATQNKRIQMYIFFTLTLSYSFSPSTFNIWQCDSLSLRLPFPRDPQRIS